MEIFLSELLIIQEELRNVGQITDMVKHVRNHGYWTEEVLTEHSKKNNLPPGRLIEIVEFPDGQRMVQNGHHRCVATYIGGRDFLRGDEFFIRKWKYSDYLEINFEEKWVTPLDPRTHIRVSDIGKYKKHVLSLKEDEAREYIEENSDRYIKKRTLYTVPELASTIPPEVIPKKKWLQSHYKHEFRWAAFLVIVFIIAAINPIQMWKSNGYNVGDVVQLHKAPDIVGYIVSEVSDGVYLVRIVVPVDNKYNLTPGLHDIELAESDIHKHKNQDIEIEGRLRNGP